MHENTVNATGKRKPGRPAVAAFVLVCMAWVTGLWADPAMDQLAEGKRLATERSKGNCLACHVIEDGPLAGNIGPPLIAMKARFPERKTLYRQIWDATERNPESRMPPFGKHGILTAEEIELIVEYLYSL